MNESLEDYMQPVDIIALPERPFFHFKTNRIGLTHDIEAMKIQPQIIKKEYMRKTPFQDDR